MPFTDEDKILINYLFNLKGYDAKDLVREFASKLLQKLQVTE